MNKILFIFLLIIITGLTSNKAFAQRGNQGTRNDTLVFKTKDFVIQPNDKLDDLLRRIPNVIVDKDGKLFVQGEKIAQFLVEGKEFFSDDALSAAHVIRADKVAEIKVYWRWSDQSSFTGVEDDIKIRAMNVFMKKE